MKVYEGNIQKKRKKIGHSPVQITGIYLANPNELCDLESKLIELQAFYSKYF